MSSKKVGVNACALTTANNAAAERTNARWDETINRRDLGSFRAKIKIGITVSLPFRDKANPIRRAVVRREWRYKPHCCRPGLPVSSLGARSAVPRQSVPLQHMRRPKCEESLDRYYPRAYSLARLIERRVYRHVMNRMTQSRENRV